MRVGKNTDSAIWMHRRRLPNCTGPTVQELSGIRMRRNRGENRTLPATQNRDTPSRASRHSPSPSSSHARRRAGRSARAGCPAPGSRLVCGTSERRSSPGRKRKSLGRRPFTPAAPAPTAPRRSARRRPPARRGPLRGCGGWAFPTKPTPPARGSRGADPRCRPGPPA